MNEETLIEFLLELNERGLINNYDLDYEKEAKDFVKRLKLREEAINAERCCETLIDKKVVSYDAHKDEWNAFLTQKYGG